jgi:hypothetical protein
VVVVAAEGKLIPKAAEAVLAVIDILHFLAFL